MKMYVFVIGIQASLRGSCTLAKGATAAAMPRSARATANAIRRSVGPAGRFARTMPFWSAASVNGASIACCRSPLADPPCGQSGKYAFLARTPI